MSFKIQATIYGNVPSKSNAYRISGNRLYKTDRCKQYELDFRRQWVNKGQIKGWFEISLIYKLKDNRQDLDGCFKVVLDCLQKVGAIENDNKCVKIYAEKHISEIQRVDILIKEHK